MKYKLEIQIKKDYLAAKASGRQTYRDNETLTADLMSACAEHKVDKVLVDLTNLVGQPGTMADFQLANYAVNLAIPVLKKVALVSAPANIEFTKFFETAASNRGLNVRAFLDEQEALAWIKAD